MRQARIAHSYSDAGFSLIETLVTVAIVSVLMVLLGEMLLNVQRTEARLSSYFAENRHAFYTRQQLRQVVSGIANIRSLAPYHEDPLFTADNEQISGHITNVLFGEGEIQPFTLTVDNDAYPAQLNLSLEDDRSFAFTFPGTDRITFSYLSQDGAVYDVWPPEFETLPVGARDAAFKIDDLMPEAILFTLIRGEDEEVLVFNVYG